MKKSGLLFILLVVFLFFNNNICDAKSTKPSGKGYLGILPELTRKYVPKEKNKHSVISIPAQDFNSENALKPVPQDDPTFVNIILKPDKMSKYTIDLNEFIPILENIYDVIDASGNVQVFNAKVYYFNKSADYFKDKYADKPESNYITYKKLMELNTHAHSVALLRSEAVKYNPYLAYHSEGYVYNPNNIQQQLDYLKNEIQQTILLIREGR